VLTIRDGKIVRIQDHTDQAAALQTAGLPTGPCGSPLTPCRGQHAGPAWTRPGRKRCCAGTP
jgi:hypothetical protein